MPERSPEKSEAQRSLKPAEQWQRSTETGVHGICKTVKGEEHALQCELHRL